MRINLAIVLILLLSLSSFGQYAGRRFVAQDESLIFINDSLIDFTFKSSDYLYRILRGIGKYKILENQLIIQTSKQDSIPTYKIEQNEIRNNSDSTIIYFKYSKSLSSIVHSQISFLDSTYKPIGEGLTDKNGIVTIKSDQRITFLNYYDFVAGEVHVPFSKIIGNNSTVLVTPIRLLGKDELLFNLEDSGDSICLTGPLPLPKDKKANAQWKRRMHLSMMTGSWPWKWNFKPGHIHDPKRHCLIETNK